MARPFLNPAFVLWLPYALLLAVAGALSSFAILSSDTFPLLVQAELLLHDREALYNGFFPIGYPIVLRMLLAFGRGQIDVTGVVLHVVVAYFYLKAVWDLASGLCGQTAFAWFTVVAIALLPAVLRAIFTVTPDFGFIVLVVSGFAMLQKQKHSAAGWLFGTALLLRMHGLALAVAVLVAVLVITRDLRSVGRISIGIVACLLVHMLVQVAAGHPPFESAQVLNVYKLMYGVNWSEMPTISSSVWELISNDPAHFGRQYWAELLREWHLPVIFLLGLTDRRLRVMSVASLLFVLVVAVGGSVRGSLAVQPVALLVVCSLAAPYVMWLVRERQIVIVGITVVMALAASYKVLRRTENPAWRVASYDQLVADLALSSPADAKRVYTDDFALYFPQLENATPHVNGGWGVVGLPVYLKVNPQFSTETDTAFLGSMLQHGARYVALRKYPQDYALAKLISESPLFVSLPSENPMHHLYRVR